MSIDQALHASESCKSRRVVARQLMLPVAMLVVLLCTISTVVCAQDAANPSAADYVAAKNRVAMARVEAELAKIERDAKGEGKEQGQGGGMTPPYGSYVQPLPRQATPADPTVLRVKANSDGTLIAMIALGNDNVIPAWAGKSIRRGITVQSVTTSDVIVKDGGGVHPLAWGDGSSNSNSSVSTSAVAPAGAFSGGVGLAPPPAGGN